MTLVVSGVAPRQLAYRAASQLYEKVLATHPDIRSDEGAPFCSVPYLKWALSQICIFANHWDEDKLHRWLGWSQAISNCLGITTVEEERDRIRNLKVEMGNRTLTPEDLEKIKHACQNAEPIITIERASGIEEIGARELLEALRDRIPQICNAIDLDIFLGEVEQILDQLKAKIRATELRDERE